MCDKRGPIMLRKTDLLIGSDRVRPGIKLMIKKTALTRFRDKIKKF